MVPGKRIGLDANTTNQANKHQIGKWCLSLENVNAIEIGLLPVMIDDRGDGGGG